MAAVKQGIGERLKGILYKECCICGAPLFFTYLTDSYGNAACISHSHDIVYCASCSRMCGKDRTSIGENRYICSKCIQNIPEEKDCSRIIAYARKVLTEQGLVIPSFQFKRVEASEFSRLGHPDANGLALISGSNYTIYTLKELINTAFAEVIAHEMTHTWQWENGIVVKTEICEGFCNLSSYIVLKTIDTEMARIKVENLERNPDAIYGEGFRKVKEYYDKYGMQKTIQRMMKHK